MDNSNTKKINISVFKIVNTEMLEHADRQYHSNPENFEQLPWADGCSYREIAEDIIPDRSGTSWANPVFLSVSYHSSIQGIKKIAAKAEEYTNNTQLHGIRPDILSISACMVGVKIELKILLRPYTDNFNFIGFFQYIGENVYEEEKEETAQTGRLVIPKEIAEFKYTDEEVEEHHKNRKIQEDMLEHTSPEKPFLNSIEKYYPKNMTRPEDHMDFIYDLKTADMSVHTVTPYDDYTQVFREVMRYVNGVEYYQYVNVMKGNVKETVFMEFLENYIRKTYINEDTRINDKFCIEDLQPLLKKLYRSLFQMYIVQDLIDDPNVTDIKITAPDAIRARIKGKAYITNITFIDRQDYLRFINGIALRNNVLLTVPDQTFTDTSDENYILRFSISAEYVNSVDWPYLHIRKIPREKLLGDDLIKAGMMDEKIRDYLLDCGKISRGVVFAGPPGSGKTFALNWFLEEAYEQSAEILVIQENDELFCYRKGVMFKHVVNYSDGQHQPVNLEQLGQMALVAGANVFVIGEAKGAEICSAITLSNSGCRTAITIHSPSSTETIEKMADLAMRGYAQNMEQAMEMLKSFQTIVYLEGFKVREISEITGYNRKTKQMEYRYIYRSPELLAETASTQ